jgi:Ser/Thr protein kinase RdoA (MazF antagonist)
MIDIDDMINGVVIQDAAQQCWLHFRNPRRIISAGFTPYEAAPAFDPALVVNRNGSFHED